MEQQINEAVEKISTGGKRVKKGNKKPWIVIGVVVAVLAVTYMALCAYANSLETFYPNSNINFIDVSGLTPEEAQAKLDKEVPAFEVPIYSEEEFYRTYTAEDPLVPLAAATLEALGFNPEAEEQNLAEWVSTLRFLQTAKPFLSKGWDYFQHMMGNRGGAIFCYYLEGDKFEAAVDSIQQQLTVPAVDTGYTLEENTICITRAKAGYYAERDTLKEALSQAGNSSLGVHVPLEIDTAVVLTAQEIYDQVAGEMKNAGYDSETDSIIPEKVGAEFDVKAAQSALDAAAPGETVTIPAVIQFPTVTAADLKAVLFRDVLGEYTTNVSGTTARRNNVKLSASTINNYVMNTGDVFSYNGVVGQRTAANGYQPAPAYVKGETVDEIGGGICQTSSTLSAGQSGDYRALRPSVYPRLRSRRHGRHRFLGRPRLQVHQQHRLSRQNRHQLCKQQADREDSGHKRGRQLRPHDQRAALHHGVGNRVSGGRNHRTRHPEREDHRLHRFQVAHLPSHL